MNFKIIIRKWAIFYFFVQNLSEWHFSCRKDYNHLWRKELGSFTHQEKEALRKFKKIHKQYSFSKDYLGTYFYLGQNCWNSLEQKLSKQEINDLKSIFTIFNDKFELFYNKELPLLKKWQEHLCKKINNFKLNSAILKKLNTLYKNNIRSKQIKIFLHPSGIRSIGGMANKRIKGISLEISRYPLNQVNRAYGVIWHEMIHLLFEEKYLLPLLRSKFTYNKDIINLIKEVTASSLFPNGLLGNRFLRIEESALNKKLPILYNKKIIKLSSYYLKKNEHFNEDYIDRLYLVVCRLKGFLS